MKPDGGPAFPGFNYVSSNVHDGMTLRDYFAATALQGMLASELENDSCTLDNYANDAYRFADVMIAERAK